MLLFSSRSRHTRCLCVWSSGVGSSDLRSSDRKRACGENFAGLERQFGEPGEIVERRTAGVRVRQHAAGGDPPAGDGEGAAAFGEYILRDDGDLAKHQLTAKAGRNARDEPAHPSREAIHCTRTRNRRLRNDTIACQIRPMRVDLSSQAYFRNPAAEIARLRAAGAVVEVRFPIVGTVWTTTTQELA